MPARWSTSHPVPFHKFEYDCNGVCVRTGINTPPPPTARLFVFPTLERFGFIWAFNGESPLWDLPNFEFPDDELHFLIKVYGEVPTDPHVLCCNTPDYHHYRTVHGLEWSHPDPDPKKDFRWTDHSFEFDLNGSIGARSRCASPSESIRRRFTTSKAGWTDDGMATLRPSRSCAPARR